MKVGFKGDGVSKLYRYVFVMIVLKMTVENDAKQQPINKMVHLKARINKFVYIFELNKCRKVIRRNMLNQQMQSMQKCYTVIYFRTL